MTIIAFLLLMQVAEEPLPRGFVGPPAPTKPSVEADDPQSIRMRIEHNMRATEEQLKRQNVKDEARRLQDHILLDIDQLLAIIKRPPQAEESQQPSQSQPPSNPPPNGEASPEEKGTRQQRDGPGGSGQRSQGSSSSNQPKPGSGSAGRERQPGEQTPSTGASGGESRRERRARAGQSPGASAGTPQPSPGTPTGPERQMGQPGSRPGDAAGSPGNNPDKAQGATMPAQKLQGPDRLADVSRDVWGHLPETLRQEVDHYYRERFMPRYRELLQQYYNRLAESDRRGTERK